MGMLTKRCDGENHTWGVWGCCASARERKRTGIQRSWVRRAKRTRFRANSSKKKKKKEAKYEADGNEGEGTQKNRASELQSESLRELPCREVGGKWKSLPEGWGDRGKTQRTRRSVLQIVKKSADVVLGK